MDWWMNGWMDATVAFIISDLIAHLFSLCLLFCSYVELLSTSLRKWFYRRVIPRASTSGLLVSWFSSKLLFLYWLDWTHVKIIKDLCYCISSRSWWLWSYSMMILCLTYSICSWMVISLSTLEDDDNSLHFIYSLINRLLTRRTPFAHSSIVSWSLYLLIA